MLFDIEELVRYEGISPNKMSSAIELALVGLMNTKTKEAKYLTNTLESIRDECDACEFEPEDFQQES